MVQLRVVKYLALLALSLAACDAPERGRGTPDGSVADPADLAQPVAPHDLWQPFDPDAACAVATETAVVEKLPVDIIWMVDNSSSMSPAIDAVQTGLNSFATLVDNKMLDYRIVMLSLRSKTNPVQQGGTKYGICIPQPLSAGTNCENGPRFFHSSVDVLSTQPLEQFLGTLGQTAGYQMGDAKGGEPWKQFLRANATKTIVVVSDDNARLSATQFETFAGGKNPFNSLTLPAGILDPSWNGLFTDYTFSGIYGWDSVIDPTQKCTYTNGTQPPSPGPTYTTLVNKTSGVRAKICGTAASWMTFFDQVAQAVAKASKISCDVAIPTPSSGTLDPSAVNVTLSSPSGNQTLFKVANAAACGPMGGWYYDDDLNPTRVLLCPTSCTMAQPQLATNMTKVLISFGCASIIP